MPSFETALAAYQDLPRRVKSAMLSTVNADGTPHASYAPFVMDDSYQLYLLTSGLSAHTHNLARTGQASVLIIEDESQTPQVFARQRLTYDCRVLPIHRQSDVWDVQLTQMEDRFGDIVAMLRQLEDFQLFQLIPQSGRFVMGFGAAYAVDPSDLSQLQAGAITG
ncbi:MAG: pyridoxamine 5'-phosphate oxidase family protein [Leptolyngbya sp.]|nr:pyridoxamine 5'-phosphate oxidase family protein [Leptolyngbya sp.]